MFESHENRSFAPFSGFGAIVSCTANQAAAEQLVGGTVAQPSGWLKLANEVQRYPTLSKTTQDAVRNGADAAEKWYTDAFTSSGWCARKEDLAAYQSLLERVAGAVAGEIASRGLVPVDVKGGGGKVIVAPAEDVTAGAGWWGLTLGVLAFSAATIVARRRRAGFSGVKSFRQRYGKGRRG